MKKTYKILTVMLVAILSVLSLVACGPSSDPAKALDALKSHGYEAGARIAANSEEDKAYLDDMAVANGLEAGDIVADLEAGKKVYSESENKNSDDFIEIIYFKNDSIAKKYWNMKQENIDYGIELNRKEGIKLIAKRQGSMIYIGTAQAVKDAR